MQLVIYPDRILKTQCQKAPDCGNQGRAALAAAMWKIMDDNKGVGLAAPQVGLNIRMFVWKERGCNFAIWNPKLSNITGVKKSIEGCLSLPGVQIIIERARSSEIFGTYCLGFPRIVDSLIRYNKIINNEEVIGIKIGGDSIATRIWQHEIDHLNGKLIIDNMSVENGTANHSALEALQKNTQT